MVKKHLMVNLLQRYIEFKNIIFKKTDFLSKILHGVKYLLHPEIQSGIYGLKTDGNAYRLMVNNVI